MTAKCKAATFAFSVALLPIFCGPQSASAAVPSHKYNKVCDRIHEVSGRKICHARRSVTWKRYDYRKAQLAAAKHACFAESRLARATVYDDATGYRGDKLADHPLNFAELSTNPFGRLDFAALGGLPYRAKRYFHYRRHDVGARKLDIGAGGSRYPDVDLWNGSDDSLAARLHFKDGIVRLTRRPCRKVFL